MPHLRYRGRFWRVSSDELAIPSGCAATLRLFWVAALVAILVATARDLAECRDGWVILTYLCLSTLVSFLTVLCEGVLTTISLKVTEHETSTYDFSFRRLITAPFLHRFSL
jgi:hypothetical protein